MVVKPNGTTTMSASDWLSPAPPAAGPALEPAPPGLPVSVIDAMADLAKQSGVVAVDAGAYTARDAELDDLRAGADAVAAENAELQARVAIKFMEGTDEERAAAKALIDDLKHQVTSLRAQLDAAVSGHDMLLVTNGELKQQVAYWRRKFEGATKPAKASGAIA